MSRVDIVGHFGSRLSYATVASEICKILSARQILGNVSNLDDRWHPSHEWLRQYASEERGSHVIIFSEPRHYFDTYTTLYGRQRVAVFASPNTNTIAREHAECCADVGHVFAPSRWCAKSVEHGVAKIGRNLAAPVDVIPLGISEKFAATDTTIAARRQRTAMGVDRARPRRFLHVATDRAWPGRKGTDELIAAWAMFRGEPGNEDATLTIHAPRSVFDLVHAAVGRHRVFSSVDIVFPENRGSTDEELVALYSQHDMLVLTPRCEGYGMMILAGLVHCMPTVTVCMTGQEDFLGHFDGWSAVPVGLGYEPLAYEEGSAPVVEPIRLATALVLASAGYEHLLRCAEENRSEAPNWTWPVLGSQWADAIGQWMEGSA